MRWLCGVLLVLVVGAYVDIDLEVKRENGTISYGMPMKVHTIPYILTISLMNKEECIMKPIEKLGEKKWRKERFSKD